MHTNTETTRWLWRIHVSSNQADIHIVLTGLSDTLNGSTINFYTINLTTQLINIQNTKKIISLLITITKN